MSYELMQSVIDTSADLSLSELAVLVVLARFSDEDGTCFPSERTIGERSRASHCTVKKAMDALEERGFITRKYRPGDSTLIIIDKARLATPPKFSTPTRTSTPTNFSTPPNSSTPTKSSTPTPPNSSTPPHLKLAPTPPKIRPLIKQEENKEEVMEETNVTPLKTQSKKKIDFYDIPDDLVAEFKDLRKRKRSPITQRVVDMIKREADKAGWTLTQAVEEMIARGWQGFKADWVSRSQNTPSTKKGGTGANRTDFSDAAYEGFGDSWDFLEND